MLSMGSIVPRMALRKGTMPYTRKQGEYNDEGKLLLMYLNRKGYIYSKATDK